MVAERRNHTSAALNHSARIALSAFSLRSSDDLCHIGFGFEPPRFLLISECA